ncbi:MAG: hypothetical protein ACK5OW_00860 [bacterium]|jgi:hypothetical protein
MKIILDKIREVLTESRVEDVKKRFPNVDSQIIDYFVNNDPSGNQKYLDWMVKAITHKPTLQTIGNIMGNNEYLDGGYWGGTAAFISVLINRFHNLLPYLVHEENGKKVGTTDLYQYKFSDSEMINYLIFDLDRAEERKKKKELSKKLKSEADKIYEDKNWLVVRARTWEASCHYGAGTKWCTTSKESDTHFKRETDRQFLIYVINKNETSENPLYKVAWQIPYDKKINKYMKFGLEGDWEIDWSKIKLWNAEDTNIANRLGSEYLLSVPKKIKAEILKYMQNKMDEMYENMGYVDDPNIQALVTYLGLTQEEADEVIEERYTHYGLKIYTNDDHGSYAVGIFEEAQNALREWAEGYYDDIGPFEIMGDRIKYYVTIPDADNIASEDATFYVDDISDDDLIDYAKGYSDDIDNLIEEYNINSGILEGFDDEISELMTKLEQQEISEEEYKKEMEEYEAEKEEMEEYQPKLLERIREKYRDEIYKDKLRQMEDDPWDWLREMGWADRNGLSKNAINSGLVEINRESLIDDLVDGWDFEVLSDDGRWDEVNVDSRTYYIFNVS